MATAPMNIERSSDLQPAVDERKPPNLLETNVTTAKPSSSKTSTHASRLRKQQQLKKRMALKVMRVTSRAREVQSTLGNENPTFIKTMVKSNITGSWMAIPLPFGRLYLPKRDLSMVIEDESGEQFKVKFSANSFGLGAGWKNFASRHNLLEVDALIFQLVDSHKFKVYIVRANGSRGISGATNVITNNAHAERITPAKVKTYSPMDHFVVNSQVQGGSTEPNLSLKTFNDFHIMVDNRCIDLEISEEIRMNYYNICIGRNEILHTGVREGLYYKLVAGVIGETVNVANTIRNCKLTTTKEEFAVWDSSLAYFELIGMKVGFLRDRIRALTSLAFESEGARKYMEAKEEQNRNANEIKALEAKLVELHEVMDGLKEKAEKYKIEFQKTVDAPW